MSMQNTLLLAVCSLQSSDQLAGKKVYVHTDIEQLQITCDRDTLKSKQECNCQSIPNPPKFLTKCLKPKIPKWSFTKVEAKCSPFFLLYNPSSVALWLWFCLVKFSWNAETVKLITLVWCQRMPSICHFCTSTLYYRSWWLNQPIWKICSSNWIISPGVKI